MGKTHRCGPFSAIRWKLHCRHDDHDDDDHDFDDDCYDGDDDDNNDAWIYLQSIKIAHYHCNHQHIPAASAMHYGHCENPAEVVLKILLEFPVGGLMQTKKLEALETTTISAASGEI